MDTPASGLYVGGDVHGHVVVGSNNLVVGAEGSSLSALIGPLPPTPRRTPVWSAMPRAGPEPVGRDAELSTVGGWLDQRLPVEIHGEPGIGKSTLLRRVAAERSPTTDVVYLSVSGLARDDLLQEIFQAFYDVAGYRPEPTRMRRLLGSVQALLVLDDFAGSPEDLTALLDAIPSCDVIIAGTRRRLFGDGKAMALRGLGMDDARAVLTRHLERRLTNDESETAGRLWEAAQGNPGVLVQTAAAVRTLWDAGPVDDLPRISLDVAEPVLAPVLAGRLDDDARRTLTVLAAFGGDVPVCRPALAAMSGDTDAGVTALVESGLVEDDGIGCLLAGSLGRAVARHAGDPPALVDLAADLTRWVDSTTRRGAADAVASIIRMLDRLLAAHEPAAAVPLARAAAPRLALSLRLDAWSQVLSRGRAAAHAARAAADEAYFVREEEVRRRVLAWAVVGAAAGSVATVGIQQLLGTNTAHFGPQAAAGPPAPQAAQAAPGPQAPQAAAGPQTAPGPQAAAGPPPTKAQPPQRPRPRQSRPRKALMHPATTTVAVAFVVAATIVTLWAGLTGRNDPPTVSAVTTLAPSSPPSPPPSPLALEPTPYPTPHPTPSPSPTPTPSSTASPAPTVTVTVTVSPQAVPCVPGGRAVDFGSVPVGSQRTISYSFYSAECHPNGLDTEHMSILGPGEAAYRFTKTSCPDVIRSNGETCHTQITFAPQSAGMFEATLFTPEAGVGTGGHGESSVVGVGTPPATAPPSPASPTPAEPTPAASPAPTEPTPTPTATVMTATVGSAAGWADTGITLTPDDRLQTAASGEWTVDGSFTLFGPDGSVTPWPDNYLNLTDIGVCGSCATTATEHWAALVGYVGDSPPAPGSYTSMSIRPEAENVFLLGGRYDGTAPRSGRLWLSINDNAYYGNLSDNTGFMTVEVRVDPG
jgi:hypothetical protein